jgi:hypothetical protein
MTGRLRVSVKQLNLFGVREQHAIGGCPRSWGLQYLDGLKSDVATSPHLINGIKFHACCEALLGTGRMPEPHELQPGVVLTAEDCLPEGHFGRMARAALPFLPVRPWAESAEGKKAGLGWTAEAEYLMPWTTSKGVECDIDVRPDVHSDNISKMFFIDWKSTGNKRNALKSLESDVQANVYARGLMRRFGKIEIHARWVYVDTKTYAAWPVDGTFGLVDSDKWIHENLDATIELIHVFRGANLGGLDLPADIDMCGGTGRFCDPQSHCLKGATGPVSSRLIQLNEILKYKNGT